MAGWTKRQIISEAFSEIGKGDYSFDMQPEEFQSALRRLDAMMATWGATVNIRIGYSGGNGFGDVGAETEVPDWAVTAMYLNLAISLAPTYGKTVSVGTKQQAKTALDSIMNATTVVATRYLGGYAGAGNGHRRPVLPAYEPPIETGAGGVLDIGA
ncbi:MAG: packaged DNA stabilization gp4 family protein [Pseudomonadota bacterium]